MDDGEVELAESSSNVHASLSVDSFLDELLKTSQTCTHTHTCNPPGPDSTHTHTCYHTHTKTFPSEEDNNPGSRQKRPSGNKEAVRKYREKKKAHSVYLEEEVKKLRFVNQQLVKKLQRQAILESEILRLRGVLVDLRGKIDNELSVFPLGKQSDSSVDFKESDCTIQPSSDAMNSHCESEAWKGNCQNFVMNCQGKVNDII